MAFMIKKKRYKFMVDLSLDELSEVSYSKAILFAKVRQLEGGAFCDVSKRMEVQNHRVKYNARFQFPCKMNANASSCVLDGCRCRISIRMEEKGGRHFRKIGFTDINLAEYAGGGPSTQRYILQPYDLSHRLDNSILQVTLNITLKEGDTIFQRPLTRHQPILLPGEEQTSKKTSASLSADGMMITPAVAPPVRHNLMLPAQDLVKDETEDQSHTRNSSTTSQASVGYSSQHSQPGHSRQSSSGESTHGRSLMFLSLFKPGISRRKSCSQPFLCPSLVSSGTEAEAMTCSLQTLHLHCSWEQCLCPARGAVRPPSAPSSAATCNHSRILGRSSSDLGGVLSTRWLFPLECV